MNIDQRQPAFQRNPRLEELLAELSPVLAEAESRIKNLPERPSYPVILVIGAPRSGTTLMMQWLASIGLFAVPSNLMSRFYASPYLGARIQQLLTDPDYDHQNELGSEQRRIDAYQSLLGKTTGLLQPNEYWYFWRRFIPNIDPEWLGPESELAIDRRGLLAGLGAIEKAFARPVATKGIILQYNLECLRTIIGNVLFINVLRDPLFNIQSLLDARRTYYGDERIWYSAKPKEFADLMHLDPVEQVAGQVYYTQASIRRELLGMPSRHALTIGYEAFCARPADFYDSLRSKLTELGYPVTASYQGPGYFEAHNSRQGEDGWGGIVSAYERFCAHDSSLKQHQ